MIKLVSTVGFIIINEENKILFVKRLKKNRIEKPVNNDLLSLEKVEGNSDGGEWSILFETVEEDENSRDVIRREVKKALNCEVGDCNYFNLYFYDISDSFIKKAGYFYGTIVGEIKENNPLLKTMWVNLESSELDGLNLIPEQREALNDFINFFQDKFLEKME
ncbi:MAG: NUDIX hydrolase [Candidatus Moraniibacteriota bacterium]